MLNEDKTFQDIGLNTLALLELFFKHDGDDAEDDEIISDHIALFLETATTREVVLSLLILSGIIKSMSDSLELTFEEFQNRVIYPMSLTFMNSDDNIV